MRTTSAVLNKKPIAFHILVMCVYQPQASSLDIPLHPITDTHQKAQTLREDKATHHNANPKTVKMSCLGWSLNP